MLRYVTLVSMLLVSGVWTNPLGAQERDLMIVGLDHKPVFAQGGIQLTPPGRDTVAVFDLKDPANPSMIANIPLINSAFGPPTNLAITPDQKLAIITNAFNWVEGEDEKWQAQPDNRLHVLDLTERVPKLVHTAYSDKQPSGIAISPDGATLAVANRDATTVTFYTIDAVGKKLDLLTSVPVNGQATAVAFEADGDRVLVSNFAEHEIAVIERNAQGWEYQPALSLPVGRWPYNVQVARYGDIALSANNGSKGLPDGHTDTVSIIDLAANPPQVIDHLVVGDAPEGIVFHPNGKLALVAILNGSADLYKDTWVHNTDGKVIVLKIDGKKVTNVGEVTVGGFPEGIGFNKDGTHAYVGNLTTNSLSVLQIDGTDVSVIKTIDLPGPPGSLRTVHP